MQPELQERFDAVEKQRDDLRSSVAALGETQLNWTPDADAWSVQRIIEHLVLSDEAVGRARDANVLEAEAPMFRVLPRAWRRALVIAAFRRNMTLPLPSPAVEPRGNAPLSELWERWATARNEMRRVLDTLPKNERRWTHPVLGPLTAAQMLELEQAHTAYHARQMQALQNQAAFPKRVSI